jgi:hypothetical protein
MGSLNNAFEEEDVLKFVKKVVGAVSGGLVDPDSSGLVLGLGLL